MKTLKVKLMQHTPLIHFQHNQYEATLRASEVKPKLDRFILTKLGEGNYNNGSDKAKKKGWLIGKGVNRALDYKIHVSVDEKKDDVNLKITNENGKSYTTNFPMLLSNMGGKDTDDELVNFSMYENVYLDFFCRHDGLLEEINKYVPSFFAINNFGQRTTKGFGSFSVVGIDNKEITWNEKDFYSDGCIYMTFCVEGELNEIEKQEKIFNVIDFYWKCMKSGVNYPSEKKIGSFLYFYLKDLKSKTGQNLTWEKDIINQLLQEQGNLQNSKNSNNAQFVRGLFGYQDKYTKGEKEVKVEHIIDDNNKKIDRIPSPIYFKPICIDKTCHVYNVYILFDKSITLSLTSIEREKRTFKISNNEESFEIKAFYVVNSKNYMSFMEKFHKYLSEDKDVLKILYLSPNYRDTYIKSDKGKLEKNDLGFVPKDFNWNDILGNKGCVTFNKVIK